MAAVETEMAEPEAAPKITETRILNATTIYMAWEGLEAGNLNGPIIGYDITVSFDHIVFIQLSQNDHSAMNYHTVIKK